MRLETKTKILKRVARKLGRKSQKKNQKTHGIRWGKGDKKLEMRLGRDGIWWEKGNTENEVGEGWSLVGEREHRE